MRIVVLNPNSTESVTEGIDAALDPLRLDGGPSIECATLAEGPPGIESDAHVQAVVAPIARFVASREAGAGAFIIACFSDPGLAEARGATRRPVLGMAACGVLTATALGSRFGVVSILEQAIPRHLRYYDALGLGSRLAGDRAVGIGVTGLSDESRTLDRMMATGRALRDEDGADVLVLGCAGMARYRERLEDALGIPVVDPVQAAVGMAISVLVPRGSGA
jgi:allantoin racemase